MRGQSLNLGQPGGPTSSQVAINVTIYVNKNGSDEESQAVIFRANISMDEFLEQCSNKLQMKARRLFDNDGVEIADIENVKLLDHVWVSQGEDYNRKNSSRKTTQTTRRENFYGSSGQLNATTAEQGYFNSNKVQIAMFGRGRVGKSSIALRYVNNLFQESYDPTFQDKHVKTDYVENNAYQVEILDTAGEEDYNSVRSMWMQNKDALYFVYSVDNIQSFEELANLNQVVKSLYKDTGTMPLLVVIGNKCEINTRVVSTEKGFQQAQKIGALFYECSAKTGFNVLQCFQDTIKNVVRMRNERRLSINKKVDDGNPESKICLKCQLI